MIEIKQLNIKRILNNKLLLACITQFSKKPITQFLIHRISSSSGSTHHFSFCMQAALAIRIKIFPMELFENRNFFKQVILSTPAGYHFNDSITRISDIKFDIEFENPVH